MKILSPNEFISNQLHKSNIYSIFIDFDNGKLSLLDHIFNTIGSGIDTSEEFIKLISGKNNNVDLSVIKDSYSKDKYSGYTHVNVILEDDDDITLNYIPDKYSLMFPARDKKNFMHISLENQHKYPDVILWKKMKNIQHIFTPYPNFEKIYSTIYKIDFDKLQNHREEWINIMIYFYTYCKNYFESKESLGYENAFPSNSKEKDLKRIEDYQCHMKKYESNEAISEAYELEYNGDIEDFITRRWEKDKSEWIEFCNDSINFLENKKT